MVRPGTGSLASGSIAPWITGAVLAFGLAAGLAGLDLAVLALGGRLSPELLWIAIALACGLLLAHLRQLSSVGRRALAAPVAVVVGVLALGTWVCSRIADTSYDGNAYHQEAILQLVDGWNPLHEPVRTTGYHLPALNGYPKAAWLLAANIALATGSIQAGKVLHWVLWFGAWCATVAALRAGLPQLGSRQSIWLATLAASHPVFAHQSFTFLVDGDLALCLIAMLAFAWLGFSRQRGRFFLGALLPAVLALNVKTTGVVFVPLLLAGMCVIGFQCGRRREAGALAAATGLAMVVGAGVFGYNPYVTNARHFGHPLYPVFGPQRQACIGCFEPESLRDANRARTWFASTFSAATSATHWQRKWPWKISRRELAAFQGDGPRAAGNGPWSALTLLGALGLAVASALGRTRVDRTMLLAMALFVVATFVHPKPWWSRYVPMFYWATLLPLATSLVATARWRHRAGTFFLWIASGNLAMILLVSVPAAVYRSVRLHEQLDFLSGSTYPTTVWLRNLYTYRVALAEHGVPYAVVANRADLPCADPVFSGHLYFCNEGYDSRAVHSSFVRAFETLADSRPAERR